MFEKKGFKTWVVSSSFEKIRFSSINVIFPLDTVLSERGLTVFENPLLSVTFFHQCYYSTAFLFPNSGTQ